MAHLDTFASLAYGGLGVAIILLIVICLIAIGLNSSSSD